MKVVIRVDASLQIGTGHVMRCLTLAEALKKEGADVEFICRSHEGHLIERIRQQVFETYILPDLCGTKIKVSDEEETLYGRYWLGSSQQQDAELCRPLLEKTKPDWLIVDHYGIDKTWQTELAPYYGKLMVIDDLANRRHQCDLLLDQTYGRQVEDYTGLVPQQAQLLLGSEYALLRPEFAEWRGYSLQRRRSPEFKKLLITMGGVDPDNITGEVLAALGDSALPKEIDINVVMGASAPHLDYVKRQAELMPYKTDVKVNVSNMAEMMANTDLAIGAAGTTTWERCCLGVPSLMVVLAANQREIADSLSVSIAAIVIDRQQIRKGVTLIESMSKNNLLSLSKNAAKIVGGRGVDHVIQAIQGGG